MGLHVIHQSVLSAVISQDCNTDPLKATTLITGASYLLSGSQSPKLSLKYQPITQDSEMVPIVACRYCYSVSRKGWGQAIHTHQQQYTKSQARVTVPHCNCAVKQHSGVCITTPLKYKSKHVKRSSSLSEAMFCSFFSVGFFWWQWDHSELTGEVWRKTRGR